MPAYRGDQPFAFVSYAHADAERVLGEIAALIDRGYRVYYDDDIRPGSRWHEELAQAIETCAVFVLFATTRSVDSPNCQRELAFALEADKPVLAVHLEDIELPAGIRLAIGDRQAILRFRLSEADYRTRLEASLNRYVGMPDDAREAAVIGSGAPLRRRTRAFAMRLLGVIGILIVLGVTAYLGYVRSTSLDARASTLEQARELLDSDQYGLAFSLLRPLVQSEGIDEPILESLWRAIVNPMIPLVAEAGAIVYFKPYDDVDGQWVLAGTTPIETPIDAPKGTLRFRIEKPGFRTGLFTVANPGPSLETTDPIGALKTRLGVQATALALIEEGAIADDLVLVPPTDAPVFLLGWSRNLFGDALHEIPAFAIGRREVTNTEYKAFVDAGGYDNDTYWDGLTYVSSGQRLDAKDARARFVDLTERAGPAGWEAGSFTVGTGELPVGGISWYEAVAYARYRGLTLPTAHHWARAAHAPFEGIYNTAPAIANHSQFAADGPRAPTDDAALGPWGTVDTAGNLREWVWNFAGDSALALGGSWSDYAATYQYAYTTDPMNRSLELGMRLMQRLDETPMPVELLEPIALAFDETLIAREPVSDDAFEAMRFQFTAGSRTPLDVSVSEVASTDVWIAEEVVQRFADDDQFVLYVVRPRSHHGTLQSIVYAPPGDAFAIPRPNVDILKQMRNVEYVVKGGRALLMPIWAGSYRRFAPRSSVRATSATRQRRAALAWHQDIVTTMDYIATRDDLDVDKVGILGISYGTNLMCPIVLAIEGRLKSAALIAGGISLRGTLHPMIDAVNYLPRVHQPALMVSGRYDHIYPYEQSQKRFFDLLGTPPSNKRHAVYDVGHFAVPGHVLARDVTDWFDNTLGSTR